MESTVYLSFVLLAFLVIIIPGPNVFVVVATSVQQGRVRGLQAVAGTSQAMCIQLLLAAISTSWFVHALSNGFYFLKWAGVAYFVYLGIRHIKLALSDQAVAAISATTSFTRGFIVSLSNPKTILFFSAFFPQFVDPAGDFIMQTTLLSVTFLLMALILDSCYAILSACFQPYLQHRRTIKMQNAFSGGLFLLAGTWLSFIRRS